MLTEVKKWAAETGAVGIRVISGINRTDAHEFYRNCGYVGDKMQVNLHKTLY